MTKPLLLAALFLASGSAMAADVLGARVNATKGTLEVDVGYGGGCGNKKFDLEVSHMWGYSDPMRGNATIVESGMDACEAYLRKTLVFSLRDYGLAKPNLRAASLTIRGDNDTSAEVTLPYEL